MDQISPPKTPLGNGNQQRFIAQAASTPTVRPRDAPRPASNVSQRPYATHSTQDELRNLRLPKAVQATYLAPLKRTPTHGIPVCDLQLRSYSVRNLELFADFCLRAAYYLNLPAKGAIPLPKITERWTTIRSNFVHKKSQENFERVTMRRLVQIQDGHPETVNLWLAYIKKNQYYGVGMKANVFEHGALDTSAEMDSALSTEALDAAMTGLGGGKAIKEVDHAVLESKIHEEPYKAAYGAFAPMGSGVKGRSETVMAKDERTVRVKAARKERRDARE